MQVLVDADLVLELLLNRVGLVEDAEVLWEMVESQQIQGYITEFGLDKIRSVLSGLERFETVKNVVSEIQEIVRICPVESNLLQKARSFNFRDFESAVEVACAIERNLDVIVTQNPQNFDRATLPIWSVNELLEHYHITKIRNRNQLFEHENKLFEHNNKSFERLSCRFVLLKLLSEIKVDHTLAVGFTKAVDIREFQMGDELINYNVVTPAGNCDHNKQNAEGIYVVCQGQVRLLGFNTNQQQELSISVSVLRAGETFGTERLFCTEPVAYRALADSDSAVQVACWMSLSDIKPWLEQLPSLQEYLRQQAIERQCLIFFKTSTELRSLSSYQLQQLLPYLVEKRISQGESLVQATSPGTGRFWLKSGQIQSQSGKSPPPIMGQSWGYPKLEVADWVAQTDLVIYHLPEEHWEAALVIAPVLGDTTNVESQPQPIDFPKPVVQILSRRFWQALPFIEQQSSSECGAACLAMISQYWGKSFSINTLRNLANVDRSGASLKGLAKAAETLGFQVRPVRASLSHLESLTNPWIAHWEGSHYIVVYRVKRDCVLVADPATSKKWLSRQQFLDSWTGYALVLDPTERLLETKSEKVSLRQFRGSVLPYRSLIWQLVGISFVIQIFGVITPLFTQIILDKVVVQKGFVTLNVFALGLLLSSIWRVSLSAARQYMLDYFSNRFDLTKISGFIKLTLLLPLQFFESRRVGDIITRVQENRKVQLFITRQAILAWLDALMAVVYVGLMFYYNWRLTLLVLGLIPPIVLLTLIATPLQQRVSREIFNAAAAENSLMVEMLNGVATVKAAAAEHEFRWRWEDLFTSALNSRFRSQKVANGLQATGGLINTLGFTALLWYGATLVIQNQLSIGEFVAFVMMIGYVINPVLAVANLWDELQEVLISVERLNDVFAVSPEELPGQPMLILPRLRGEVRFENVTFRYNLEADYNTLENISFEVKARQTVAK
jgi:ATP-binding cassette subfamily B protein